MTEPIINQQGYVTNLPRIVLEAKLTVPQQGYLIDCIAGLPGAAQTLFFNERDGAMGEYQAHFVAACFAFDADGTLEQKIHRAKELWP